VEPGQQCGEIETIIHFSKNSLARGSLIIVNQETHVAFKAPQKSLFQNRIFTTFNDLPAGMYDVTAFDLEQNGLPAMNSSKSDNAKIMLECGSAFGKCKSILSDTFKPTIVYIGRPVCFNKQFLFSIIGGQ